MLIDPDPQATNTTRTYGFELSAPDGSSLAGIFDGTEVFRTILWAGEDRTPAWQSDSAATWAEGTDFTTPGADLVVVLTIPKTAIMGLEEGTYNLQVILSPDADDIEVYSGQIKFIFSSGTAPAPAVYATFEDLEDEYPAITDLQELPIGQTGFAEERAWARRQVDTILLARASTELTEYDRLGVWDTTRRTALEGLQDLLGEGRLEVTDELRRICALYALGRILLRQLGKDRVSSQAQQGLAYLLEARWALLGFVARVDADGDGSYEQSIG